MDAGFGATRPAPAKAPSTGSDRYKKPGVVCKAGGPLKAEKNRSSTSQPTYFGTPRISRSAADQGSTPFGTELFARTLPDNERRDFNRSALFQTDPVCKTATDQGQGPQEASFKTDPSDKDKQRHGSQRKSHRPDHLTALA